MSNKPPKNKTKTNITKITASSNTPQKPELEVQTTANVPKTPKSNRKSPKTTKTSSTEKPLKNVFILFRPFVTFGRYLRDSWREIRQVRWPNRKATWKMVLAVFFYCAIFMIFILVLDTFFTFIFNQLLNIK